jgi:hypothetical protein
MTLRPARVDLDTPASGLLDQQEGGWISIRPRAGYSISREGRGWVYLDETAATPLVE